MSMEEERAKFWENGGLEAAIRDEAAAFNKRMKEQRKPLEDLRKVLDKQVGGTHYQNGKIQPIEYIMANELNFAEGCVVKRVTRHRYKDGVKDILKAMQELSFIAANDYGVIVNVEVE